MDLGSEVVTRADIFNKVLEEFLKRSQPTNLYDAARHLPMAGGKRLRPVLCMLCCEAVSGSHIDVLPFAIGVELVHNFSLVHDDIMDKSTLRRNLSTVHIEYGEPTAIIAGDLLFAKAFESLGSYPVDMKGFRRLYNLLIRSVINVCEGQQYDMNFEGRLLVSEEEYLKMIQMKTAALFRISSEGGALAGGANEHVQNQFAIYGNSLGLAFQIQDDVLDMSSTQETLGKDIGNDIRNGKKTLIAVHALTHATGNHRQVLKDIFGKVTATDDEIQQVHHIFKDIGSIDYAKDKAMAYSEQAIKALDDVADLEPSATSSLKELASYAITREK
jgi:geranylgeranyl diphosphate synthase, type I